MPRTGVAIAAAPRGQASASLRLRQKLVHEGDGHAALADGRRNALDRAQPHVAAGEHAGHAGGRPPDHSDGTSGASVRYL